MQAKAGKPPNTVKSCALSHGKGLLAQAESVRGIDDDGAMRLGFAHGDGVKLKRVAGASLEGADAPSGKEGARSPREAGLARVRHRIGPEAIDPGGTRFLPETERRRVTPEPHLAATGMDTSD